MDPEPCCETHLPLEGQVWGLAGISSGSGRGHRGRTLLGALVEALLQATPAVTSVPSFELLSPCWKALSSLVLLILACILGNPSPDPWIPVRFILFFEKFYLFLALLGLHCCLGFSLVASRGHSLVAVLRHIAVASLLLSTAGSRAHRLQ